MLDMNGIKKHKRWQSFYTWCRGGFNNGWDIGQGIANLLPRGVFGLFMDFDNSSKVYDPAKWLTKGFFGPVFGALMVVMGLIPAIIEGLIFKRPFREQNENWATKLVDNYGVILVWGALAASGIWLAAMMSGYVATMASSALMIPLALSYGLIFVGGLLNGLKNLYGSMLKLYVWGTQTSKWDYAMKGLVNVELGDDQAAKEKLNQEFEYEMKKMAALDDEAYARLIQENDHPPTAIELNKIGVLTYFGLQKDQSDFLKTLAGDKKLKTTQDKIDAIDARRKNFNAKYGALI
jgi:hypothetical protein